MKIYVMRHGTTIWNEKGITQGHSNNRLSLNGKKLAEEMSLKYKNTKFDMILASPLMRTMQTANIMNKYHNVKILKDERLIEINQGIFTGRHKDSLSDEEKKLKYARSKDCGMESFQEVYERLKLFIDEVKNKYLGKTILIVTHNACASLIENILCDINIDFSDYKYLAKFGNAEVKCFDI